ncbi:MAG: ester cyclase, partial [Ktedonobacteraceae bacterium]|nr:ester cyclase [Ktedonobacteraceae bacterium]
MLAKESKALVLRYFQDFANGHQDLAILKEIISPQIVDHAFMEGLFPTPHQRGVGEALPDMYDALEVIAAADNRVAVRVVGSGTHTGGTFFGVPATGKRVTWTSTILWQTANSKITERWNVLDFLSLMIQLGVVPPFKHVILPTMPENVSLRGLTSKQEARLAPPIQDQLKPLTYFTDSLRTGNLTRLEEIVAPDYIDHGGWIDGLPGGPEGIKQEVTIVRTAFPDLELRVPHLFVAGEYVVLGMEGAGTHRDEIFGVPATHKQATW